MIHRYQKKGLNFVLDVNSGAVHLLDDVSYAVTGLLDETWSRLAAAHRGCAAAVCGKRGPRGV